MIDRKYCGVLTRSHMFLLFRFYYFKQETWRKFLENDVIDVEVSNQIRRKDSYVRDSLVFDAWEYFVTVSPAIISFNIIVGILNLVLPIRC